LPPTSSQKGDHPDPSSLPFDPQIVCTGRLRCCCSRSNNGHLNAALKASRRSTLVKDSQAQSRHKTV
jgi:hypothetical protein